MCESVNSWLCVIGIVIVFITIAKVLELSSKNMFRIKGIRVETVNNVVSILTFSLFLILGYVYLFYM